MHPKGRDILRKAMHGLFMCVLVCVVCPNLVCIAHQAMDYAIHTVHPVHGLLSPECCGFLIMCVHVAALFTALSTGRWLLGVSRCGLHLQVRRAMDLSLIRVRITAAWLPVYWQYGYPNPSSRLNADPHFRPAPGQQKPSCYKRKHGTKDDPAAKWCPACLSKAEWVTAIHTQVNMVRKRGLTQE